MNECLDWLSGQWLPNCTDLPQMIEAASNHGCDVLREGQLTVEENSQAGDLSGKVSRSIVWCWNLVICCRVPIHINCVLSVFSRSRFEDIHLSISLMHSFRRNDTQWNFIVKVKLRIISVRVCQKTVSLSYDRNIGSIEQKHHWT